jgi:hypothetical protein
MMALVIKTMEERFGMTKMNMKKAQMSERKKRNFHQMRKQLMNSCSTRHSKPKNRSFSKKSPKQKLMNKKAKKC